MSPFACAFIDQFDSWPPETFSDAGHQSAPRAISPEGAEEVLLEGVGGGTGRRRIVVPDIDSTKGHPDAVVLGIFTALTELLASLRRAHIPVVSSSTPRHKG